MQQLSLFKNKHLFYLSKDLPGFYYSMFPEMATFKYFAWIKTLLNHPGYAGVKFDLTVAMEPLIETGKRISDLYTPIPGTEIMNVDNILTTLRQIEYYKDTDQFASEHVLTLLYKRLEGMVDHMEQQATEGCKFLPGSKPGEGSAELKIYVNDFIEGDNSIIAVTDNTKTRFINHNILDFLVTRDKKFTDYSFRFMQNIVSRSMLISVVGERDRARFFNLIRERICIFRGNQFLTLSKF